MPRPHLTALARARNMLVNGSIEPTHRKEVDMAPKIHEFIQNRTEGGDPYTCDVCGEHRDEGVHDPINAEKTLLEEHANGQHAEDVFIDCPKCSGEWDVITARADAELLAVMRAARAFLSISPSSYHADAYRRHLAMARGIAKWAEREAGDSIPGSGSTEVVINRKRIADDR